MCLLQTSTSAKLRAVLLNTPLLIEDIYDKNADGLGAMYATKDGLKIRKVLPKNAAAARKFIESLPNDDRELALHWRWRTHGDINLAQCHPYTVEDGVALMHNGILDTGNKADPTRSDTSHFIENFIKGTPADTLHHKGYGEMLGEFIGQNKFAIMSADGRLTVINKDQGVEFEGVWYSNEYAWTPSLVIPSRKKAYKGFTSSQWSQGFSREDMWGTGGEWMDDGKYPLDHYDEVVTYDVSPDLASCLEDFDSDALADLIEEFPLETLRALFSEYDVSLYDNADDTELTTRVAAIRQDLVRRDTLALMEKLEDDETGAVVSLIATTLMWYCNTDYKTLQPA